MDHTQTPAGWYPDPQNAGQQRYWDGAQWAAPAGWYPDPQNAGQQRYWDGAQWAAPAGWYPDPDNAGQQRYWDGAQWAAPGVGPKQSDDGDNGPGTFGDGISAPLFEFKASRFKGGRRFTPNVIRIWPDRIEEYEHHVVKKKVTQAINFTQVAQVKVQRGLAWSDLVVESTGGHTIEIVGMHKAESQRVKTMLDEAVRKAKAPAAATAPASAPVIDVADQLTKLALLRDQGVLTEAELKAQKVKLLG